MRSVMMGGLAAVLLLAMPLPGPAVAAPMGQYEVSGVDGDDMLKMRAGPGTGYKVVLGLPNGTRLRIHQCQQTGSTRWCEVSLDGARGFRGYVSWAYLRKL